jgi:hypothetical protein
MADNKKSSISKRSSCYLLNLKQPDKTARRLKLSLQRTSATVTVLKAERAVPASVGFLDVSETGAGIFTPELLHKGAHVELSITEPAALKVQGIVAWSIPVTSGIHGGTFRCRSGIQFVLEGESQIQAVQEFVRKAGQDPIENFKAAMAEKLAAQAAATPPAAPAEAGAAPMAADAPVAPAADAPAADVPAADAPVAPVEAVPAPVAEAPAADAPVAEAAPAPDSGTPDSGQQAA